MLTLTKIARRYTEQLPGVSFDSLLHSHRQASGAEHRLQPDTGPPPKKARSVVPEDRRPGLAEMTTEDLLRDLALLQNELDRRKVAATAACREAAEQMDLAGFERHLAVLAAHY